VRTGARCLGAIVAALVASGILTTVALGTSCAVTVRWDDTVYESLPADYAVLEAGAALGRAEIPHCDVGGRCAPPEETVAAFEIPGIPREVAILAPGYDGSPFLAPGTFPELPDHPLHEAVYGLPTRPSYRADCGAAFVFEGTVTQVSPLRVEPAGEVPGGLTETTEDGEHVLLQVDSGTTIEGFDRNGVATLAEGDEIRVRARACTSGELAGPLADSVEPAR
jgi:uncharacterized protein DUF6281